MRQNPFDRSPSQPWHANPDHPMWKFLRIAICVVAMVVVLGFFLAFNYKNGFTANDIVTILGAVSSLVATLYTFGYVKQKVTSKSGSDSGDDDE